MSKDSFNPYHEWLGLDRGATQPNFYQLLGLDPGEQSLQRIAEAGSQAMARLRSCRPGSRGAEWAKVLEEVTAAAGCLSDPLRRAEYDRQLGRGGAAKSYSRPAPRSRVVPTAGGSSIPLAGPLQGVASPALPMQAPQGVPAASLQSPGGTTAYLDPMAPVASGSRGPAGPMPARAPSYGGGMPPPASSLASYPAAHGHPAPGIPAQTGPGKECAVSAKVRQRSNASSLPVIAVSAGVGMIALAVVIVLIVLSLPSKDQGRGSYGSFAQKRPVVNMPSSSVESFHRPAPPPRRAHPVERQTRFPVPRGDTGVGNASDAAPPADLPSSSAGPVPGRGEVLTQPTFAAPRESPPLGSQSGVMPQAVSPADSTLRLPAFPAAPTLPSPDGAPPATPQTTLPGDSPTMPSQTAQTMPDGATAQPTEPGPEPGLPGTQPGPPKPAEASAVTSSLKPEEVAALAKTLKAAHDALQNRRYDEAEAELKKVATLPKLPEDHAKYERLTLLAGYAKNFQSALEQAVAGLHAGDEIEVGSSTIVGFVSAAKDSITLRVTGTNRTYALDSLPAGLAVAIADRWMKKDDPASLAMKGAYVATLKDIDEERKAKAREWLEEASKKGIDGELYRVLDDRYGLP